MTMLVKPLLLLVSVGLLYAVKERETIIDYLLHLWPEITGALLAGLIAEFRKQLMKAIALVVLAPRLLGGRLLRLAVRLVLKA